MSWKVNSQFTFVMLAGAFGGFLAWIVSSFWLQQAARHSLAVDGSISVLVAMAAAVIFVYLIANTDRSDTARLYPLAIVAGFFWEPVIEASKALVTQYGEEKLISMGAESTHRIDQLISQLADKNLTESQQASIQAALNQEISNLTQMKREIRTVDGLASISTPLEPLVARLEAKSEGRSSVLVNQLASAYGIDATPRYNNVVIPGIQHGTITVSADPAENDEKNLYMVPDGFIDIGDLRQAQLQPSDVNVRAMNHTDDNDG